MANPTPEELYYAVQRGDEVFQCLGSELKDKLQEDDVMAVHRPTTGVTHGWAIEELIIMPWEQWILDGGGGVWHVVIPAGYDVNYPDTPAFAADRMFNLDGTPHVKGEKLFEGTEIILLGDEDASYFFEFMGPFELGELTDTRHVTSMMSLFEYSDFKGNTTDFTTWDMSKVQNMAYMFINLTVPKLIAPDWDLSSCTNFYSAMPNVSGGTVDLSNWKLNTSENVSLSNMFEYMTGYGGVDLSKWDTSGVNDMDRMFHGSDFDTDISGWCAAQIPTEPPRFAMNSPLDSTPAFKPKWGQPC